MKTRSSYRYSKCTKSPNLKVKYPVGFLLMMMDINPVDISNGSSVNDNPTVWAESFGSDGATAGKKVKE